MHSRRTVLVAAVVSAVGDDLRVQRQRRHSPHCSALPAPGVDWYGCDLSNRDLTGANLSGADLSGAILNSVNLSGANLTGADLTVAFSTGSVLTGANLTGADLTGATLTNVSWWLATCPDGTFSNDNGFTCLGHLV
jgi:uncharacterized protein YjbI with pentapeptide repeats